MERVVKKESNPIIERPRKKKKALRPAATAKRVMKALEPEAKIEKVMKEFKDKVLTSSSGKKVTTEEQALAISFSEAARLKKEKKKSKPTK